MATSETFNAVLKRYMPYPMIVEEMKKRNYFWNKVKKDQGWMGGVMDVPFEGGEASSLSWGSLTASTDVSEGTYLSGTLSTIPELWGTMKFNEKDLDRHGDLEKSFLKIFPDKLNQFVSRMTERVSLSFLTGKHIAKADIDGTALGVLGVDHPERFTIGEKVTVDDDNSSPVSGYVTAIDINVGTITVKDARTAGSAVDLSGYTVAQNAKVYVVGAQSNAPTSLKDYLLPASLGGSDTICGLTKATSPILQALRFDGAAYTASGLLGKVFENYYDTVGLGKGNPTEIVCSFNNFKHMAKTLEAQRDFLVADKSAGYGFRSLKVVGNEGDLTITAVRDMDNSEMYVLDWDAIKVHGNNFFERKRHMNGDEFFLERATSGYTYLVDVKFFAELVVSKPSHCAVIHSIPTL